MAEVDLDIRVNAIVDKKFKDIEKSLKKTEKAAKDTEKGFLGISNGALLAGAAIAGIGKGLSFVVDQAIVMEDLTTQFIAFTGSAESAEEQLKKLADFSASTPFQLEDLANANRTLLAFGSSADESLDQLKSLGEAAAATGTPIGELATILGQVQAAEKLTGERFLQFAERGIPLTEQLAKQMGVAESEIRDMISAGKISDEEVTKAFENMASAGGKFEGSMLRLSKTLSGSLSTAKDNVAILAAEIGKKLTPSITAVVNEFSRLTKGVTAYITESKPEKLRVMTAELQKQKRELNLLEHSFSKLVNNVTGSKFFDEEAEKADRLRKSIKQLEKEIVNVSVGLTPEGEQPDEEKKSTRVEDKKAEVAALTAEESKLLDQIATLQKQAEANRKARETAKTDEEIAFLDDRFAKTQEKLAEQEALKLELEGQGKEAELARAQAHLDAIEAQEQAARDKAAKARSEEFNFYKRTEKARTTFDQQTWQERARTTQTGLAVLASLQSSGSREAFEIGKAAAIAQSLVAIPSSAVKAYDSLAGIPYVGPALGIAAAAAAVAAGTARVNQIRSTKFTAMSEGGLVEGGIPGRDSVPLLAQRGEVVVPEKKYDDIAINNDQQIVLLGEIKNLLERQAADEENVQDTQLLEPQVINVELMLDNEVLANQILELNRDNQRIS